MHHLKSLENSFNMQPIRVKVELFLFPLILLFGVNMFIETLKKDELSVPIEIVDTKKIVMKKELIDILKDIEKFALENEIYLEKISKEGKSFRIEIIGSLKKSLQMFVFLESYNNFAKIKSFDFLENRVIIVVDFNRFYKKENQDFSLLLDEIEAQKDVAYKLSAIIDSRALINDIWYKIDEKLGLLRLSKINTQSVVLENRYKKIELKLIEDE